jgi:hypothetical protein
MTKSRRIRWAGHIAQMGRTGFKILAGKKPLGRPTRSWVDNIKRDVGKIEWTGVWTGLVWLRVGINGWLLLSLQ